MIYYLTALINGFFNSINRMTNVRAGKLLIDYHIRYENSRIHAGRSISLTLEPSQA